MKKLEKAGDYVELAKGSSFIKFELTEFDQIEVSEYFGYDFKRSYTHSRVLARERWKAYLSEGYVLL